MKAKQERGEEIDNDNQGWMLELLELMQLQADAEAMETDQVRLASAACCYAVVSRPGLKPAARFVSSGDHGAAAGA